MLTDKELVDLIWHDKVKDNMPWKYCADGLEINLNLIIEPKELQKKFQNYFKNLTGISPYTPCPKCKGQLLPRKGPYGYLIGCSNFPKCRFMAASTKPYKGY